MMKKKAPKQVTSNGLIATLDIGTAKIACFIANAEADLLGAPRVVGVGHREARGLRSGTIIDIDAAEQSIRLAVEQAEKKAGNNVKSVVLSLSGASLSSYLIGYEMSVAGHQISHADLRRILDITRLQNEIPADRTLIHALPVSYAIDGIRGVRDPQGMYGDRLSVNLNIVHADTGPLRNIVTCVNRCHLDVAAIVASPYAAGLACLIEDERELGVTLIDMGAGTTTVAVFFDGEMIHTASIPIGGSHVTSDLACGLSTSLNDAERIKILFGAAVSSPSDEREMIRVPVIGNEGEIDESIQISRAEINEFIQPRLEEIFEMVRNNLTEAGFERIGSRRLVLTGGASQLPGMREMAGMIFDKQVRVARPRRVRGLAEIVSSPAFTVTAGLLNHAMDENITANAVKFSACEKPTSSLSRVGMWLREYF